MYVSGDAAQGRGGAAQGRGNCDERGAGYPQAQVRHSLSLSLSFSHESGTPRSLSLFVSLSLMKEDRDTLKRSCAAYIAFQYIRLD